MNIKDVRDRYLDIDWLRYNYNPKLYKTYFHPIYAPDGQIVTADSPPDEVHHRGLCVSWGNVNEINFWAEEVYGPEVRGRITHKKFTDVEKKEDFVEFTEKCDWLAPGNKKFLDETRCVKIYAPQPKVRILDISFLLSAVDVDIIMGTPPAYHGLCYRASNMQHRRITNSEGNVGEETAKGKRARWADLSGILDGKAVGVTIFDNPSNPRFPTKFFTLDRSFGFISTSFSYDEAYIIKAGDSLKLTHRVLVHSGDASSFDIEGEYKKYIEA